MEQNFSNIDEKINKKGEISPFLFLSQNLELLHGNIYSYLQELLKKHEIDMQSLFTLPDDGEALKIAQVKHFLEKGSIRPRFAFQVFVIENISRMTLQSQNACLKFFEEPGEGNIIFITNNSEGGILETILSRVSIVGDFTPFSQFVGDSDTFYYSMIESHISKTSDELVRYFFSGKYEKEEYINFLKTLVNYITEKTVFIELLDDLHEDIGGIVSNNLQGKYIVDKYIMLLRINFYGDM